jgi:hypothetical protein
VHFNIGICFHSNVGIFSSDKNLFYWKFRVRTHIINPLVRVRIWSLSMLVLTANVQKREGQMLGSLFYFLWEIKFVINNFDIKRAQKHGFDI